MLILLIQVAQSLREMKAVIYDYKLATGTVIARFVIQDTNTELQPELAIATNVDNGTHYVASAPDEISYDGHIYERIGAAEQTGNVGSGNNHLDFLPTRSKKSLLHNHPQKQKKKNS